MAEPTKIERRLVAVFAADVEGYSRLMGADEVGTLKGLTERRVILDKAIGDHRGRIANTAGDSVLAAFSSAVDAVQCAVEAQAALAEANTSLSPDKRINFRIGIHVGDVMVRTGDLFGDGVNIAARLQTLAQPGSICVSGATYEQVRKVLPIAFGDLGPQQVKNIGEPVRAFAMMAAGGAAVVPAPAADTSTPLQLPDKPSIAVLPFTNMSGDPEQEYFADGIVEDIVTALSRFRQLFVIARNSSFTYKGRAVDVKQVGGELGVRYVLEGSVRKSANKVRITGQLIDASIGTHLWADRYEGPLEDIFDLQDQVTASVVGAIVPKLEQAEIERAKRKPTESLDAYDYYLRGMASLHRYTRETVGEALRLFYRAIELDPDFASAYGMAVRCYGHRKSNGWITDHVEEGAETARLARRVAELGKDDAVALCFGGHGLALVVGDLDAGIAMIDRALVINPNLAVAWTTSGWVRNLRGEAEIAISHLARAMRLSPLDPIAFHMQASTALAHFLAGRYDEASSWAERALGERANDCRAIRILAASRALAGRLEEARAAIARLQQLEPAFRISDLNDRLSPFRPQDLARYEEGLRKAGLPE